MKIKTCELTGPALDWAVAKCEGLRVEYDYQYTEETKFDGWWQLGPNHWRPLCGYSTDWAIGGPLIEREGIDIYTSGDWLAEIVIGDSLISKHGPTPLIAAMRAFVASALGDEVEVPKELAT